MTGVEGPATSLYPGYNSQSWITTSGGIPYFSVPMPVEKAATPAEQCGRFVNTGIHVVSGGNGGPFPSQCGTARADAAGEGVGVPDLRAVGLPAARQPEPTPPPVPPPGAPNSPPPAVSQPPAPPPPPPPPPPPMVD